MHHPRSSHCILCSSAQDLPPGLPNHTVKGPPTLWCSRSSPAHCAFFPAVLLPVGLPLAGVTTTAAATAAPLCLPTYEYLSRQLLQASVSQVFRLHRKKEAAPDVVYLGRAGRWTFDSHVSQAPSTKYCVYWFLAANIAALSSVTAVAGRPPQSLARIAPLTYTNEPLNPIHTRQPK